MQNQRQSEAARDAQGELPYVPGSRAELLSASHVFAITPVTLHPTAWSKGADQLEHRQIQVHARLLEVYKGKLDVTSGADFTFSVKQHRESELVSSDFHGVWSHTNLAAETPYLILSQGATHFIAELLDEDHCRAVLDQSYLADAKAAVEGERLYQGAGKSPSAYAGERALLDFALQQHALVQDLFARYVWARLQPVFPQAQGILLGPVLEAVEAEDATLLLRQSFIADLYNEVLLLEPDPDLTHTVVRSFFTLLRQPSAARLQAHLVDVELYNLTVRDGKANLSAESVFPNPADRERYRVVLERFDSDRARQIQAWLSGGKRD